MQKTGELTGEPHVVPLCKGVSTASATRSRRDSPSTASTAAFPSTCLGTSYRASPVSTTTRSFSLSAERPSAGGTRSWIGS